MLQNRVLLCGDGGVGKSSFVQFVEGKNINDSHEPTDLVKLTSFNVVLPNSQQKINLWDLSGNKTLTEQLRFYFKNVDVVIFMFDTSNAQTFESLNYWVNLADSNDALTKATYVVVANKIDSETRAVSKEQSEAWAQLHRCEYFEISLKQNESLDWLLAHLAELCIDKQRQRLEDIRNPPATTALISSEPVTPRKCC